MIGIHHSSFFVALDLCSRGTFWSNRDHWIHFKFYWLFQKWSIKTSEINCNCMDLLNWLFFDIRNFAMFKKHCIDSQAISETFFFNFNCAFPCSTERADVPVARRGGGGAKIWKQLRDRAEVDICPPPPSTTTLQVAPTYIHLLFPDFDFGTYANCVSDLQTCRLFVGEPGRLCKILTDIDSQTDRHSSWRSSSTQTDEQLNSNLEPI